MKKIVSILIQISMIASAYTVYAQCDAFYEANTKELSISRVHISSGGDSLGDYEVEMKNEGNATQACFRVARIEPVDSNGFFVRRIRDNGYLLCGGRTDLPGFGYICSDEGNCGFDIDLCRAVAAAVINSPTGPINFVPVSTTERSTVLKEATVDILSRNTTWTSSREADWGHFTWIMFYDGQGFMVKKKSNIDSMAELNGKPICVVQATTTYKNLEDKFEQLNMTWVPVLAEESSELIPKYLQGECDAITTDKSGLAALRAGLDDPENHKILDVTISKEPLTPAIPVGDEQFLDIVKFVMFGLINAEELGITQANVESMMMSTDSDVKILLGVEGDCGQEKLGLAQEAIAQAIRTVGNYGEIYERHLGQNGVNIPRGPNQLWTTSGGLIYAPPMR